MPMFIRRKTVTSKRTGSINHYYQLVESINTDKGPRLNVLLHIGLLDISEEERKILSMLTDHQVKGLPRQGRFSDKIEQLAEQIYFKYMRALGKAPMSTFPEETAGELQVLKESLEIGFFRSVGAELLALHYWRALKFNRILLDCGFSKRQIELAQVAILGRLLSPGSECHTTRWFNQQSGMESLRERRFLTEAEHLISINKSRYLLDAQKILIRIGRLKERYGAIAGRYDFCLYRDNDDPQQVNHIELVDLNRKATKAEFPGCYVIETNSVGLSSEEIWGFYMKLNEVESAFRCLKTDLGTRPIHHQNDTRVEAHLFYSVLLIPS